MFLGLRTIVYPAPDLAAATKWWTDVLGFGPYFEEAFYVGFQPAGYELGLIPNSPEGLGPITYWGVEDVEAAVQSLTEAGSTVVEPPHEVGQGIITGAVREPQGSLVGVIFNPHFGGPA